MIVDGQGAGLRSISKAFPNEVTTAVDTNALAAQAMLKAGAYRDHTGEKVILFTAFTEEDVTLPEGYNESQ